jgi:polar amino acid transport system permease protein
MLYVILPQALRHMVPSLVNLYVSLIKDTSLVYFIGVIELTGAATQVMRRESYAVFEIFAFVLLVYWIVCSILSGLSSRIEGESSTA